MLKDTMIELFNFQRRYIELLAADIPDSRMTEMPGNVGTHPAWQLGHLADCVDGAIALVGGDARFDDAWKKKFAKGSAVLPDRGAYPSKAELFEALDERRAVLNSLLAGITDEVLSAPLTGGGPDSPAAPFFDTVEQFLTFLLLSHESMHCGQLAVWRKAAGMPPALSRAERMMKQPAEA
jgi:hypothetical protein